MATDEYEYQSSLMPQSIEESPYESNEYNFVTDSNNGIYQSTGACPILFNLNNIYNNKKLIDPSRSFVVIPICIVSAYTSSFAGTIVPPIASSSPWATHGLKNGYFSIVHSADLTINGKIIDQQTPFLNAYVSFRMLSTCSQDDLNTLGHSIGMGSSLDNPQSIVFNGISNQKITTPGAYATDGVVLNAGGLPTGLQGGNGINNNAPFPLNQITPILTTTVSTSQTVLSAVLAMTSVTGLVIGQLVSGAGIAPNTVILAINTLNITLSTVPTSLILIGTSLTFYNISSNYLPNNGDSSIQSVYGAGSYNNGLYGRLKRTADATGQSNQSIFGGSGATAGNAIVSTTQLLQEFKPVTIIQNNYIVTYDCAVIRMCDLYDSMKNFPLTRRIDGQLRLYLNVGAVGSMVSSGGNMVTSLSSSTFVNTCPIIQSALTIRPPTATGLVTGLFVQKASPTSIFNVNLAASLASHPLQSARFYYSQAVLTPSREHEYLRINRSKKVVYNSVLLTQVNATTSGSQVNALLQSGVRYIKNVIIMPFISNTTNGSVSTNAITSGITTFSQWQSPFDTAPMTTAPIPLTNINVNVGGQSVLTSSPLQYTYESFLEHVSLYERINGHSLGLSNGLYSQMYWEYNRIYLINCSRGSLADQTSPRNVTVSFTNQSLQTIDCLIFVEYSNEIQVDCAEGIVEKIA